MIGKRSEIGVWVALGLSITQAMYGFLGKTRVVCNHCNHHFTSLKRYVHHSSKMFYS